MTLRQKTLITVGASLFICLLLYGISSVVLLREVSNLESDSATRNVGRARQALEHQMWELRTIALEYASWDDTYAFIEDGNEGYIRSNLTDETFVNLDLGVVLFCDPSGDVVFGKAVDGRRQREMEIPAGLVGMLRPGDALLRQEGPEAAVSGVLSLPDGPLMVAASPVLTSESKGPIRGTLILGRWLGRSAIEEIGRITDLSVAVHGLHARDLPREARSAAARLTGTRDCVLRPMGTEVMAAYGLMDDVYGKPALVLEVRTSREMYYHVRGAIGYLLVVVLAAGVVFGGMSVLVVDRVMLSRLARLNATVERVGSSGDLSLRVPAGGGDELSGLAKGINRMLGALERSQEDMRNSEERYRAFVEQSSDGVWRVESEQPIPIQAPEEEQIALITRYAYLAECNDVMAQIHGYARAEDLVGTRFNDFLPMSEAEGMELVRAFIRGGYRATDVVSHHVYPDGKLRYYLNSAAGIVEDGALVRAWGVQRDITGRRRAEAQLRMQTSAINAASDQIIITDPQGNIEYVNPAFERETGLTQEEVAGRSGAFLHMDVEDKRLWEEIQRTVGAGKTWQGEITSRHGDGSLYTTDTTITPVKNEAGVIEHFVSIKRDVTEKKRYEEQLDHLAHHDALTGLPNRLLLSDRLTRRVAGSRVGRQPLAVMFLDIDRFKLINDTLGHTTGDRLLQLVAKRLTGALREADTIARTGGDEFTVIVSAIEGAADAARVAERILSAFSRPFVVERQELFVTASVGISLFPNDGTDVETLIKNADTAMYRAKEQGRNNFQFFTRELSAAALARMRMEHSLRRAVERNEFVVYYQPRVDIERAAVVGAEALLRWRQPELGLVEPTEFIDLAEETGLIVPITEWVLRTACGQNRAWQDEGIPAMTVDVNISARQLQRHDLPAVIREALDATGLAPEHLGLEMTESALMGNPEVAVRVLGRLKDMGVRLFIDDFGTGNSSLSHLKRFPVDAVKIDRSFVSNVTTNADDAAIASAIVAMAHSLKLSVIAEGVETEEQLAFLRELGCDEVQGYLVERPVPAEEFGQHLRSRPREAAVK